MKKIISLILTLVLMFSFAGCGSSSNQTQGNKNITSKNNSDNQSINTNNVSNGATTGADSLQQIKEILNIFNTQSNDYFTQDQVKCMSPIMLMYIIDEFGIDKSFSETNSMSIDDLTSMINEEIVDFTDEEIKPFAYMVHLEKLNDEETKSFKNDFIKGCITEWSNVLNEELSFNYDEIESVWADVLPENNNEKTGLYIYSLSGKYYWFCIEMF